MLMTIPGIGPWTAAYISLRGLGQPDAFPATDLGIRQFIGGGLPAAPAVMQRG
jgi:AraC family transcriptional regulator of adaptative response / DNA-3-methyladenine glycosylase II